MLSINSMTFLFFFIFCIKYINSWSWNPMCLMMECCNNDYIVGDVNKLRATLRSKVYGQHLVENVVDAIQAHLYFKPQKPLTLSFHGWPGGGKNYVSSFIAKSLYKNGLKSKYVHYFIGRVHFPEHSQVKKYKENLYGWLQGNLSSCPKQLFIFDEVDKMPPQLLNAIKPMIDYRASINGIDYTQAIFIFLSNTGEEVINDHYYHLWSEGRNRESLKLTDFDSLIAKGAFNEEGGFHYSDVIKSNLIDHYIPFLPMQENHVKQCILDQFRDRGIPSPKEEHVQEIMNVVEWGPKDSKLFSKTGCKRISSQVSILVAKYYWHKLHKEL
ncbi:torsin-1A-like [Diorhabda sublineata]|uniref:torsin-1A-like n=1 Tax=Diorhabda sublineata TaxID=1163346 RepID=UPI0024E0C14A|nr:torsin-1A-like [Diorhabda sublineata]